MTRNKKLKKLTDSLDACLDITPHVINTTSEMIEKIFKYPNGTDDKVIFNENNNKVTPNQTPYSFVFEQICQIHNRMIETCHNSEIKTVKKTKESIYIDYSITDKYDGHDIFYANLVFCFKTGNMLIFKVESNRETNNPKQTIVSLRNIDKKWIAKKEVIKENNFNTPKLYKTKVLK